MSFIKFPAISAYSLAYFIFFSVQAPGKTAPTVTF